MVITSNEILSDGSVIRRRDENGGGCLNGDSVLPLKWKPRNVSAVRKFPQGCGPVVQPVNVVSQEADASRSLVNNDHGADDDVGMAAQVESLSHDVSKCIQDGSAGLIVEMESKELQNGDEQAVAKEVVSGPVDAVVQVDGGKKSPTDGMDDDVCVVKDASPKIKFPRRRVSAVRDFPPYCGLNASEPMEEERVRINGKRSCGTEDMNGASIVRLTEGVVVGGEESNGNVKDEFFKITQSDELINESLMENLETGDEVGVGGERSTEELMAGGEQTNIALQDEKVMDFEYDDTGVEPNKAVPQNGDGSVTGQASQTRCSVDAHGEDSEGMFQDENVQNYGTPEMAMTPSSKSLGPTPKDIKDVPGRIRKPRHEKRSLKDETNNLGFTGQNRIVVLCLMAPSPRPRGSQEDDSTNVDAFKTPTKRKDGHGEKESSSSGKVGYSGLDMVVWEKKDFAIDTENLGEATPTSRVEHDVDGTNNLGFTGEKRRLVLGLKARSSCSQKSLEVDSTNVDGGIRSHSNVQASKTPKKSRKRKAGNEGKESSSSAKVPYSGTLDIVVKDEEDFVIDTEGQGEETITSQGTHDVDVTLPPFGPKSSSDARNKVRETLRLFQALCRKLLQGEESKTREGEESKTREGDESKSGVLVKRVDLAAKTILQEKGRAPDRGKKTWGPVPGVEVGDEFQYRVELALVGIHWPLQGGIDYTRKGKETVAVSIVASGGYDNELGQPDCLTYSGSGGVGKDKQAEDQKLEKGNLALKNNIHMKLPVRVIRGYKSRATEPSDSKSRPSTTYIYDGLYMVDKYKQEPGPRGKLVYKFELRRIPGQPELALREVKSKKFKMRGGLCVDDITGGKEPFPICAVNTIDDEKPPSFNYITKIIYPEWYRPVPPKGCGCVRRCSDKTCSCAFKNDGEIPYNHNGAIVEAKPLVYECGPSCGCPPTCYNRVTQHGMQIQLEIFKTESRGWGVRSLSSISSGSFICEYIGELLEDTEAEKRTGNDEYLFDIGQNYNDCSLNPEMKSNEIVDAGGFTIDAANYGNVGRFINHSCSPNLYAQNVLYDQEDRRMPHIMLFAAENIPPLQELTYHYNYAINTVHDSDGNIKIKNCYCGSSECTGRLY